MKKWLGDELGSVRGSWSKVAGECCGMLPEEDCEVPQSVAWEKPWQAEEPLWEEDQEALWSMALESQQHTQGGTPGGGSSNATELGKREVCSAGAGRSRPSAAERPCWQRRGGSRGPCWAERQVAAWGHRATTAQSRRKGRAMRGRQGEQWEHW